MYCFLDREGTEVHKLQRLKGPGAGSGYEMYILAPFLVLVLFSSPPIYAIVQFHALLLSPLMRFYCRLSCAILSNRSCAVRSSMRSNQPSDSVFNSHAISCTSSYTFINLQLSSTLLHCHRTLSAVQF